MNYFIQGDAAKAQQIKAAFKAKGIYDGGNSFIYNNYLYFTEGGEVDYCSISGHIANIIKTHPDYKELELPVEPKFKVGDWVVSPNGSQYLIAYIDKEDNRYLFEINEYIGEPMHYEDIQVVDSQYHLWTIADAKDGDVLAAHECYVIFKEIDGLNIKCYCTYHYMGFNPSFHIDTLQNKTAFNPATREQRDMFFAKIREEGYEWDEKKKELRKIQPHYDIANFHAGMPVLVREYDTCVWQWVLYSHFNGVGLFFAAGKTWRQCIPYNDDTKHLLGTTDMCDKRFINW